MIIIPKPDLSLTCWRSVRAARVALLVGLATIPSLAHASVYGSLGNFDVVNDTGSTAHGFEIDLMGISESNITDTFGGMGRSFPPSVERYGSPVIAAISGGLSVTYKGTFKNGAWNVGTPSGVYTTPGESCWTGGNIGYGPSTPCDHFGVGTNAIPTNTVYKWLTETSPTSDVLKNVTPTLPAPVLIVVPPVNPPAVNPPPPVVMAQVVAPPPPNPGEPQFGTPEWVKVFTTQDDHPVALEDLVGGNGIVPQNRAETEIEWQLLQSDPGNPNAAADMALGQDHPNNNAESVVRRYEFYKYVGKVDPENGEVSSDSPVLDANGNPISPDQGGNIGAFIGAQNDAVNLNGVFQGPPAGAAVPEPAALGLFAIGLLGLAGVRRRV